MRGSFSITTISRSKSPWRCRSWQAPQGEGWTTTSEPGNEVRGGGCITRLAFEHPGGVLNPIYQSEGHVVWEANGKVFGVQVRVPSQVMGIGEQPWYEVMSGRDGDWSGQYRGDSYTFDEALRFRVTVRAAVEYSGMFVEVNIEDL